MQTFEEVKVNLLKAYNKIESVALILSRISQILESRRIDEAGVRKSHP